MVGAGPMDREKTPSQLPSVDFAPALAAARGQLGVEETRGLIWGFVFSSDAAVPIDPRTINSDGAAAGFRWLHFNLADRRADRSIAAMADLPEAARALLTSSETHQRSLVVEDHVCCVLRDFVHEFGCDDAGETDLLRFALGPDVLVTTRVHPLHSTDLMRRRIEAGARPQTAAEALDLLLSSLSEVMLRISRELSDHVERIEDDLLDDNREPHTSEVAAIRRRTVQLDRQTNGIRASLSRIEQEDDVAEPLRDVAGRLVQLFGAIHNDLQAIQQQARLLREELDLRTAQRTNRNLYVLSLMTALLLPATLVTGLFGMNTGGLPFSDSPFGTMMAALLSLGSALGSLLLLRSMGFFTR